MEFSRIFSLPLRLRIFIIIKAMLKNHWWKILAVLLLFYTLFMGFLGEVPARVILNESIRNLYFHVPMWFGMVGLLIASAVYSIRQLSSKNPGNLKNDIYAAEFTNSAILFGFLGLLTGMVWAKFTWGDYWTNDPKLNGVAIGMLIYMAYIVLRKAIEDEEKKARVSAVYNVFSFPIFIVLIFILPRLNVDSLHPGNGGNPAFSNYDLDSNMRLVFYPAVIAWFLLGLWITTLRVRYRLLTQ